MRYEAAIRALYGLSARGMRLGIERMTEALAYRGVELAALPPLIQIAGTNGKGSVSAMLASVLAADGYRVGLFTSPHLHRFTERIRLQGEPLGTREAARRISELLAAFQRRGAPQVSFFELSTLLAVEAFRDHGCQLAVMEVGLGGRGDATTALPAALSVITRIAFDHMQYLGDTLGDIAREKAGIIRRGVPVVCGVREPEALRVIRAVARERRAPLTRIDRDFRALPSRRGRTGFEVAGRRIAPVALGLPGRHQVDNAACAVAALDALSKLGFSVKPRALASGLTQVRWPARLERVPGRPEHLLDAAHNPDGCRALAEYVARDPRRPRVLVFGVMGDKDYATMLRSLGPQFDQIFYAQPQLPRAKDLAELAEVVPGSVSKSLPAALRGARRAAGPRGLVVVAGSIFLVAEARARLLGLKSDPPIRL